MPNKESLKNAKYFISGNGKLWWSFLYLRILLKALVVVAPKLFKRKDGCSPLGFMN